MAITPVTYTDFNNGDERLAIRQKLNALGNATKKLSEEVEIDIANNRNSIDDIQQYLQDARRYEYVKTASHTVTDDTYEEVVRLTTLTKPAGVYQMIFSVIFTYTTTGTNGYIRISIDGGSTWEEFRKEDFVPYITVETFPEQMHDIIIEARKENSGDIMEISFANIISEYKES